MSHTIDATYDGVVLRPDRELPLKPNTRVWLTVDEILPVPAPGSLASFLRTALSLQ